MAGVDWQTRIANGALRLRGTKRVYRSAERTRDKINEQVLRPEPYGPPKFGMRGTTVTVRHDGSMPIYTVTGETPTRDTTRLLYLHGGGYVFEIDPFHWFLVAGLVAESGAEAIVPIYPLAPVSTAASTVPMVADLLGHLVGEHERVVVMGDSAGGGLALAASHMLRDRGAQPERIILISP